MYQVRVCRYDSQTNIAAFQQNLYPYKGLGHHTHTITEHITIVTLSLPPLPTHTTLFSPESSPPQEAVGRRFQSTHACPPIAPMHHVVPLIQVRSSRALFARLGKDNSPPGVISKDAMISPGISYFVVSVRRLRIRMFPQYQLGDI